MWAGIGKSLCWTSKTLSWVGVWLRWVDEMRQQVGMRLCGMDKLIHWVGELVSVPVLVLVLVQMQHHISQRAGAWPCTAAGTRDRSGVSQTQHR